MITSLVVAGVTLVAIAFAAVRVRRAQQEIDDRTRHETDGLPTQVPALSGLDTDEVKGDPQPSRIPPASGRKWNEIVAPNRVELAVYLMRHPAARALLNRIEYARHRKPVRIKDTTDDDPDSGASGAAAAATTHVHLEPRRWPPRRPEPS